MATDSGLASPRTSIQVDEVEPDKVAVKSIPNVVRVLYSPRATFRQVAASGAGFGTLFILLAAEFVLAQPLRIASHVMRTAASPFAGITGLWTELVHFALGPAIGVFVAGVLLYYALRFRGPRRLDVWSAASVLAFAWVPHVLMVALGVIVAGLGGSSVFLPHIGMDASGLTGAAWLAKGLLAFGPSAVYAVIAARTCFEPAAESSEQPTATGARTPVIWGVAALLVVALGFSGYRTYRDWRQVRPLLPGDTLPAFALTDLNGGTVQRADLAGSVLLIDFWATWCPPCVASMPHMEQLHRDFSDRGLRLLSVNTEPEDPTTVRNFVDAGGLTFPVFADRGHRLQSRFQVQTLPTVFLVDAQGIVQEVYIGTTSASRMRRDIEALLPN